MAFNKAPSNWLGAGYSLSSSVMGMTTADSGGTVCLTTLTDAEANATTGDIRDVVRAILYKVAATWDAQAAADLPTKMTLRKSLGIDPTTGNTIENYALSFQVGTTLGNVATE